MSRSMCEVAQHYRDEFGFSVIPLAHKSKYPVTAWKRYQRRKPDNTELARWFHRKDRNIGIVTGQVSRNLCVIDFDTLDIYKAWVKRVNTPFPLVQTGKGVHVYLLCETARTGKAYFQGKHLGEIRSDGGYVVAPPSLHPNGKQYTWEWREGLIQLGSLQEVFLDVKRPEQSQRPEKTGTRKASRSRGSPRGCSCDGVPEYVENPKAYVRVAFREEIHNILRAPKPTNTSAGGRNTTLFNAVWKLKRYFGILDKEEVLERLSDVASKRGLSDKEIRRTIESALSY